MKFFVRITGSVLLVTAFLIMALASGATAGIKKEIREVFNVSPGGELRLETDFGSIDIVSGSGDKVEAEIILNAKTRDEDRAKEIFENFDVDFDQDGDAVIINAEYYGKKSGWSMFGIKSPRMSVEFRITVPSQFNIKAQTSGGSISVGDLEGEVDVKTSGGSLSFENIKGPVRGKTSGGSINLRSCEGEAEVRTSGGSIDIGHVSGDVYAHTSGGSIEVEEVAGMIDASTSGGSIMAHISEQPKGDCRLTTSGGTVTVYLDGDIKADLDAKTSSGRVHTDFPVTVRGGMSKSTLRAELNGGGPELYLRTSGGSIYLRER